MFHRVCHSVVRLMTVIVVCASILLCIQATSAEMHDGKSIVRIGVVQSEDPFFYLDCFGPTMEYLRKKYPNNNFFTEEIDLNIDSNDLDKKQFDFLFSPSGFFAAHQLPSGLRQIVTRKPESALNPSQSVGSLFVTSKDFVGENISSLKDKKAVAYEKSSLAGWLSALYEITSHGFDHNNFFSEVLFTNYGSPGPLSYILSRKADVAVIPTCEFEQLAKNKQINPENFKIIGVKEGSSVCKSSTDLFPDVVFSSFPKAEPKLVRELTLSLLTMPNSLTKSDWSIASDFLGVHRLFENLKIGPYSEKEVSIFTLAVRFQKELFLAFLAICCLLFHVIRVNQLVFKRTEELRMAISQRDAMSEVAKKRLKRLTQLEKRGMISQISSVLAHELKQPISSVANYSKGLSKYLNKSGNSDEILNEAVSGIDKGIRRAAEIVEKVRSYSKAPTGHMPIVSLTDCAQKAVDSIKAFAPGNVEISTNLISDAFIEADPLEIELLIFNLLKNSAEAVEPLGQKARILCSVTNSENGVTICVTDNGPKISKEKLEKMRSALQESVKSDGLGLGLSIILAIVEKYRAKIYFEQLEPQGLNISVTFQKLQNENI